MASEIVKTVTNAAGIKFYDRCGGWIGRQGGSENWRNNNPGGLLRGDPLRPGEVNDTGTPRNPQAVFESYAQGMLAAQAYWVELGTAVGGGEPISALLAAAGWTQAEINAFVLGSGLDDTQLISGLTGSGPYSWAQLLRAIRDHKNWQMGEQTGYKTGSGSGCGGMNLGGQDGVQPPRPKMDDPTWPYHPVTRAYLGPR